MGPQVKARPTPGVLAYQQLMLMMLTLSSVEDIERVDNFNERDGRVCEAVRESQSDVRRMAERKIVQTEVSERHGSGAEPRREKHVPPARYF